MKKTHSNSTRSKSASHNGQHDSDTQQNAFPINRFRVVKNVRQLRQAIAAKLTHFCLLFRCGYSAKTITPASKGRFHAINHIDGSSQVLTDSELFTRSNIGEAMVKGTFVVEEQNHE